jgi:hypothetical protein
LAQRVAGMKRVAETTAPENFNGLLLEAIDAALSSLGESSKIAIYFLLEEKFNIQKQEIPFKLEDFTRALERIFKDGAQCLEMLFLKNLNVKLGYDTDQTDLYAVGQELKFQKCIELIKKNFENVHV